MNSNNNGWVSTKRAEMPYFHCDPSSQNQNERKRKREKTTRMDKSQEKHTNIYPYVLYTPTAIQTYINTDTYTVLSPISGHRWCKDICPLIRGVRFLESLTILVLFSIFFLCDTCTRNSQGKWKTQGSL